MALTASEFTAAVEALTIAGISEIRESPPYSISSSDLPYAFLRFPRVTGVLEGLAGQMSLDTIEAELVTVISPVRLGSSLENWDEAITVMDAISAALKAAWSPLSLSEFTTELTTEEYGQTPYFILLTSLTAVG